MSAAHHPLLALVELFYAERYPQTLPHCGAGTAGDALDAALQAEFEQWQKDNPIARRLAEECRKEDGQRPAYRVQPPLPGEST
jgi:hypothetical protein